MFVRKKKNKSGVISIQVIAKIKGKSKLIKTIGSSKDEHEIDRLFNLGRQYIDTYQGQQVIDLFSEDQLIKSTLQQITSHIEIGPELLLGSIFDQIGFNRINDKLFRDLVISRLSNPASKLGTSQYLLQSRNINTPVQQIYRYLDKLYSTQKDMYWSGLLGQVLFKVKFVFLPF